MSYDHTQRAPMFLIVLAPAILLIVAGLAGPAIAVRPQLVPLSCLAAVFIFVALCFVNLRVRDEGDCLAIRFGPLPVFRRRIPYSQIVTAEPGRSSFLDGWGIHWGPGRGWIYNLWGFDCVVIRLANKTVRIGTDDADGLTKLLNSKIGGGPARP
jgi:hypothetical protein